MRLTLLLINAGSVIFTCLEVIKRKNMPRMTDEEVQALAEEVAINPPKVTGNGKNGFFMKQKGNIIILDDVSATWLRVTAESTQKTPSDLVSEMIREKMAVSL